VRRAAATLVALASLAFAAPASAATTWYVDASKNGFSCSQPDPCKTIEAAVLQASDGDTIEIAQGAYNESINTGKRLTFDGVGRKVFVDPATLVQGTSAAPAFTLSNGGVIRDMAVEGSPNAAGVLAGDAIDLRTPASAGPASTYSLTNVSVLPGHVSGGTAGGDPGDSVSAAALLDGKHGSSTDGVFTLNGVDIDGQGASFGAQVAAGSLTMDGGVVHDVTQTGIDAVNDGSATLRHVSVTAPAIALSASFGAHVAARDSLLRVNSSQQGAAAARVIYDGQIDLVGSTVVVRGPNPLAALELTAGKSVANSVDTVFRATATDASFPPDIFANGVGGSATLHASHSAYTNVYNASAGVPPAGVGTNVQGDPGFTNPSAGDFTLTPASPHVDRGDPAAVTAAELDLAGHKRSLNGNGDCTTAPDIGAYERPAVAPKKPCPAPDKVAPVIGGVHFKPRRLRTGHAGKLSLTLSEKATLGIVIQRPKRGRWRDVAKLLKGGVGPGPVSPKLGPKVKGKKLQRGRYRVKLRAVDGADNLSKPRSTKFKVVTR
jgi:hypothetical protein